MRRRVFWAVPPNWPEALPRDAPTAQRRGGRARLSRRGLGLLLLAPVLLAPLLGGGTGPALAPPGALHWLGTDDLGRDVLARLGQGAITSLSAGGGGAGLALALGLPLGLAAGLGGRWLDDGLTRLAELTALVPGVLLALVLASFSGPSLTALVLVLGLTAWPLPFRLARAQAMALRQAPHVRAAEALGAGFFRVLGRHVLPGAAPPVLACAGVLFGAAVLAEAALAFVGLGDPARASWGRQVADGLPLLGIAWWLVAAPSAALVLAAVGVGFCADAGRPPGH